MNKLGINDVLNVIGTAEWQKDKHFAQKMRDLLNEKITIEIPEDDYQYIIKNYTK